jgi:hypothetical protein
LEFLRVFERFEFLGDFLRVWVGGFFRGFFKSLVFWNLPKNLAFRELFWELFKSLVFLGNPLKI